MTGLCPLGREWSRAAPALWALLCPGWQIRASHKTTPF